MKRFVVDVSKDAIRVSEIHVFPPTSPDQIYDEQLDVWLDVCSEGRSMNDVVEVFKDAVRELNR